MNIVITYRHQENDTYLRLIAAAFASARKFGYKTVLVYDGDMVPDEKIDVAIPLRRDMPLMDWVLAAQMAYVASQYFDADTVLFSPDAIINEPLEEIFQMDFDIGVTVREHHKYPINNGVIFLKPAKQAKLAAFFLDCLNRCRGYAPEIRDWFGDQLALHEELVAHGDAPHGIKCLRLPCHTYNATPAYITHYKGERKGKMLAL